jgi:predicted porin
MIVARGSKSIAAAVAGALLLAALPGIGVADDETEKALKEQMRQMQQQMEELQKEVKDLRKQQAETAATPPPTVPAPAAPTAVSPPATVQGMPAPIPPATLAKEAPREPLFEKFLKGFYGTLDVSFDDTTKGINGLVAHSYSYSNPADPNSPIVDNGPKGQQQIGRLGYMPALSTNKSQIGYRNTHQIGASDVDFIVQVETSLSITASPGLKTSYTQQSNVVQGAIGLGDTFVGLQDNQLGKLKFGTTYAPYKKSTDPMNPFSGMLGDYAAIMGNTGGDNRVEFGTRLDHSVWYESPKLFNNIFSFDVLWSPGQNRTYDNVVQSAGSPDCNGGNTPGSGNLPLNCDDGGFSDAYSVDFKLQIGGLYATAAWEEHRQVNRNSDGIGANNPYYGYLTSFGPTPTGPVPVAWNYIDWNTFNNYQNEYGAAFVAANGFTPPYVNDVANEIAYKVGARYDFDFGFALMGVWEDLRRQLPQALEFQNERQRNGFWLAATQDLFGARDNISIGYGHAGATPGDPGGQHNYSPIAPQKDTADLYTIAWKHKFDKQFTWYFDTALTVNHGNAHYDLGAGGRGLTTDCHDGTNTVFNDYSSAGPTTWGGCRIQGYSTGINYKF